MSRIVGYRRVVTVYEVEGEGEGEPCYREVQESLREPRTYDDMVGL